LLGFAVTATPVRFDSERRRAFCADETGRVYVTSSGLPPRVENGGCLDVLNPLG
jgi:hypothetical protein